MSGPTSGVLVHTTPQKLTNTWWEYAGFIQFSGGFGRLLSHKVFLWLLAEDMPSTMNVLKRKNMHLQSFDCVLCGDSCEETVEHLFLQCRFSRSCWNYIGVHVPTALDPLQVLERSRSQLKVSFFVDIIILMCWSIWSVRNNIIFGQNAVS